MATRNAVANGNWSSAGTWDTGVPVDGDTANAGLYAVRFDVDVDQPNTLLTATIGYFYADHTSGERVITASANAGTHSSSGLVRNNSNGVLTFNGEIRGGSGSNAHGALNNSAGVLNVTTATGGSGSSAHGAYNNSAGVLNVTTATGGSANYAYGAYNVGAGTLNVTTATGGSGSGAHGAYNFSSGTLNVATATGGSGSSAYGAYNNSAGVLICDLAVGSNGGVGGTGNMNPGVYATGVVGQTTKVRRIQFGPYGCVPVWGAILLEDHATNSAQFRTAYGGGTKTLTDATAGADFPATSDVRYGVSYDLGDKVGTCHVPEATNVAYGVPVDNTTGTAVLTPATVRAAVGLASANLDAQLAALDDAIDNIQVDNAAIADAVWDEARSGHTTAGTYGATGEWATSEGLTQQQVRDALKLAPSAGAAAAGSVDAKLDMVGPGTGSETFIYTLLKSDDNSPIPQARIEVFTDEAMTNRVRIGYTNDFGQVTFYLDPGTYYFRRIKAGWNFNNPDIETVEAPAP